jgi:hypothetical protein
VPDVESQRVFDAFHDLSLPKSAWTHSAHLVVCWVALSRRGPNATIDLLRGAIRRYNEATGVENTPTSGYHETLTRYYVSAVHSVGATSFDAVAAAPQCDVLAPGRHWTRERLFSIQARAEWVEPDLLKLPLVGAT